MICTAAATAAAAAAAAAADDDDDGMLGMFQWVSKRASQVFEHVYHGH